MLDDLDEESEFWSGVPDRRRARRAAPDVRPDITASGGITRPVARPASRPAAAARRSVHHPVMGNRQHTLQHTGEMPVVRTRRRDPGRRPNQSLRRAGVLGITVLLLVPVAMALRAEAAAPRQVAPLATTPSTVATTVAQADALAAADASVKVEIEALQPIVPDATDPPETQASVAASAKVTAKATATTAKRTTTTTAKKAAAPCVPYTIRAGDAWITIARRAGVSLSSLLSVNKARTTTSLMPGRSICLPAGATMPAPAPKTTTKATTTTAKATSGTRAAAPTTTAPALVAPPNIYSRDQIMQIIRDVWPDDLEDHAIAIADRESHLNPSARNFCCYGLFQIYYSVHRTWLASIAVTSPAQLWDPRVNALVAYQMYLRSGFAPWGG